MYTDKEMKSLNYALKRVKKCGGNCKQCTNCHVYARGATNAIFYAFGCDILPDKFFGAISDTMAELQKNAIEQLEFELS